MSSCPGATLERYLEWLWDLIVDGDTGANPSLQIAELMGVDTRRIRITAEQFAPILALYEPYRELIEDKLMDYNEEDNGSWRDYACYAFDSVPESIDDQAEVLRKALTDALKT